MDYSLIIDPKTGKTTHIIVPIDKYEQMLEKLENYEIASKKNDDFIPWTIKQKEELSV